MSHRDDRLRAAGGAILPSTPPWSDPGDAESPSLADLALDNPDLVPCRSCGARNGVSAAACWNCERALPVVLPPRLFAAADDIPTLAPPERPRPGEMPRFPADPDDDELPFAAPHGDRPGVLRPRESAQPHGDRRPTDVDARGGRLTGFVIAAILAVVAGGAAWLLEWPGGRTSAAGPAASAAGGGLVGDLAPRPPAPALAPPVALVVPATPAAASAAASPGAQPAAAAPEADRRAGPDERPAPVAPDSRTVVATAPAAPDAPAASELAPVSRAAAPARRPSRPARAAVAVPAAEPRGAARARAAALPDRPVAPAAPCTPTIAALGLCSPPAAPPRQ